ncbi:hypothetical protein KV557_04180 [Kitasatospora aureofaciens]|uniref:hypothetical protein n=1 Tax=Kitasatospora aureofaciens TaxID=1894 RepID=UPI001C45261F|nr:hypothetical protein [Kitasatospora aureofaciens]MBV6696325.1 hypothetical protein [Kitasatospora aureofaciens]
MITESDELWHRLDVIRRERGLLTPGELLALADQGVAVLDPFSVLVSRRVVLRTGTVLYPGAAIECDERSAVALGPGNTLHGGTRITATGGGRITIGRGSRIGEGGTRITAATGDTIELGDETRLTNGAEVTGSCRIGDGAQILGPISVRSVTLAAGHPHTYPDPDGRAAVLKGHGRAHGINNRTAHPDVAPAREVDHADFPCRPEEPPAQPAAPSASPTTPRNASRALAAPTRAVVGAGGVCRGTRPAQARQMPGRDTGSRHSAHSWGSGRALDRRGGGSFLLRRLRSTPTGECIGCGRPGSSASARSASVLPRASHSATRGARATTSASPRRRRGSRRITRYSAATASRICSSGCVNSPGRAGTSSGFFTGGTTA